MEHALESAWLVQEYIPAARPLATPPESNLRHHLCLGAVDGKPVTAVTRSSRGERPNVALSARPHPVYL